MDRASRKLARDMLAKIFIVGMALTVALYYLLNTLTTGFFVYSVQNLLSSIVAGVVVGFLLPKFQRALQDPSLRSRRSQDRSLIS